MGVISRGFGSRRAEADPRVPPGQYRTDDFPVLSAGPTPRLTTAEWALDVTGLDGTRHTLSWQQLMDLPDEEITVDIHCVTKWSKFGTHWRGVPIRTLLDAAALDVGGAQHALVHSYGGYSTNIPLKDLLGDKAWVVFEYDGKPLAPAHGGPARLLVPHLYLWKSAKWINGIELLARDQLGFWESLGYHAYGDPWTEQRYVGD